MKKRLFLSGILIFVYFIFVKIYDSFQGAITAEYATRQVEDSDMVYGMTKMAANSNLDDYALFFLIIAIVVIWVLYFFSKQGDDL